MDVSCFDGAAGGLGSVASAAGMPSADFIRPLSLERIPSVRVLLADHLTEVTILTILNQVSSPFLKYRAAT